MKRFAAVLLFFLFTAPAYLLAQQNDNYQDERDKYGLEYRTFRLALVPGLSTNGFNADRYASRYSVNLLAGYNGALERGFELGGLLNINKFYAHGGQIAGLGNYSGKGTAGIQVSGLFNYSGEDMQGIQLTGLTNIADEDIQGIQLSGLSNWSGGYSQGIQISGAVNYADLDAQGILLTGGANIAKGNVQGIAAAGLVNWAGSEMQGLIFSGLFNYTDMFQGISYSTVNVTNDFQGIQLGGINVTQYGQGIQAGYVNIGKELDGVPIGLISYYETGRREIDVWTSDAGFTNFGIKLGTENVYNMISIGYNPLIGRDVWQVGWSIGSLNEYKNHFTYSDISIYKINEGDWTSDLNTLFKYRFLFGKGLGEGFKVYGGPTFNMLITRVPGSSDYTWYRLFDFGAKGRDYIFWIGYSLGIELF